jgi:hypothetical protein
MNPGTWEGGAGAVVSTCSQSYIQTFYQEKVDF